MVLFILTLIGVMNTFNKKHSKQHDGIDTKLKIGNDSIQISDESSPMRLVNIIRYVIFFYHSDRAAKILILCLKEGRAHEAKMKTQSVVVQ